MSPLKSGSVTGTQNERRRPVGPHTHLRKFSKKYENQVTSSSTSLRRIVLALTYALLLSNDPASAETVSVKYRGEVNLAPFQCETVTRSSFIRRVCYDAQNAYMPTNLNGTWYQSCEIDQGAA
jgi:hypothetical protein